MHRLSPLKGSVIVLYATGECQTTPGGVDGKLAVAPLPKPVQPVSVIFGGPAGMIVQAPQVVYAGGAPEEVAGVMQVLSSPRMRHRAMFRSGLSLGINAARTG